MAKPSTTQSTMQVKIHAPFQIYYDGPASSVSAVNDTGPFDILPRHKNFITLLSPCTLIVRSPGYKDFAMKISRGVMRVRADQTTVFLDV